MSKPKIMIKTSAIRALIREMLDNKSPIIANSVVGTGSTRICQCCGDTVDKCECEPDCKCRIEGEVVVKSSKNSKE